MAEVSTHDKPDAALALPEGFPDDLDASVLLSDGRFSVLAGESPYEFGFSYCDVPFRIHVRPYGGGVRLRIAGDVAPLPYSAECLAARRAILDILRNCRDFDWGEAGVSNQLHIVVQGETDVPSPVTPVAVVSAAINFVFVATPCLKVLAENLPQDYYAKSVAKVAAD